MASEQDTSYRSEPGECITIKVFGCSRDTVSNPASLPPASVFPSSSHTYLSVCLLNWQPCLMYKIHIWHRTHSIRKSSYCCYDKNHHQHKKTLKWWILQLLTLFPIQTMRQNCSQSEHIPCSTYSCLGQCDCTVGGATECETRWIEIKQNVLTFITCCNTIWRWYWNKKWIK